MQRRRIALFLAFLVLFTLGYAATEQLRPTGIPGATAPDSAIPFFPPFVVFYVLYFPFILVPWILLRRDDREYRMLAACFIATVAASEAIYLLVQTSAPRASFAVTDGFTWLISRIYATDANLNALPSLHASLSLLAALFIRRSHRGGGRLPSRWPGSFAAALAVLIIASAVLVKQHAALDVLAGLALGSAVYLAVTRGFEAKPRARTRHGRHPASHPAKRAMLKSLLAANRRP